MTQDTKDILLNREVIAIDQDKGGMQGKRVWQTGEQEVWARDLAGGARAVAVFNRGAAATEVTVRWADIGFTKAVRQARDIWKKEDVKLDGPEYKVSVPSHGVVLLRINN